MSWLALPGRVMDHMNRGSLKLDGLRGLVLDEADEMLQMGFAEDVEWVLSRAPAERQVALFSATMPEPIRRLRQRHLRNPAEITITQKSATPDALRQRFVAVEPHQKRDVLARILKSEPIDAVLVFVNTKGATEPLADYLSAQGHRAAALSGDVPQSGRERIVDALRAGKLDVIVATDVAARGLDVQRISHVINFDFRWTPRATSTASGEPGRASRTGNAILFRPPARAAHAEAHRAGDRAARSGRWKFRRSRTSIGRRSHVFTIGSRPAWRDLTSRISQTWWRAITESTVCRSNASQRCWRPSPRAIRRYYSPKSGQSLASTRIAILILVARIRTRAFLANTGERARTARSLANKQYARVRANGKVPDRGRPRPQRQADQYRRRDCQ